MNCVGLLLPSARCHKFITLITCLLRLQAMFLCLFSLLASMVTNIHEQTKEIGVLLALGLKYDCVLGTVVVANILVADRGR